MGRRISKSDAEIVFQIHADYVCRRFGFDDEWEPSVRVESMRDCEGSHEMTKSGHSIIRIIPSCRFDNEVLIHELAHYVQKRIEGRSCCWDMKRSSDRLDQKYDDEICDRHSAYMKQIRDMIDRKA